MADVALILFEHGQVRRGVWRVRVKDYDLEALAEKYPELLPVFEELQSHRRGVND